MVDQTPGPLLNNHLPGGCGDSVSTQATANDLVVSLLIHLTRLLCCAVLCRAGCLVAPAKTYWICLDDDANLVLYNSDRKPLW